MTIKVKVVPGSSRSAVAGEMADGTLKINVVSPPERGRANEEVCELLAKHFGVARSEVSILAGHGSPRKLVKVTSR